MGIHFFSLRPLANFRARGVLWGYQTHWGQKEGERNGSSSTGQEGVKLGEGGGVERERALFGKEEEEEKAILFARS